MASKTKPDYYHQRLNVRVTLQFPGQFEAEDLIKLESFTKVAKLTADIA